MPRLQLINVVVTVKSDPGDPPKSSGSEAGGGVCGSRLKPVVLLRCAALLGCVGAKAPFRQRHLSCCHQVGGSRRDGSSAPFPDAAEQHRDNEAALGSVGLAEPQHIPPAA